MEHIATPASWPNDRIPQDTAQRSAGMRRIVPRAEAKGGGIVAGEALGVRSEIMRPFNWLLAAWFMLSGLNSSDENQTSSPYGGSDDGKLGDVGNLVFSSVLTLICIPLTHVLMIFLSSSMMLGMIFTLIPALGVMASSGMIFETLDHRAIRQRGLVYGLIFIGCGLYCALSAWWMLLHFGYCSESMSLHGVAYTLSHSAPILYKALVSICAIDPYDLWMFVPNWTMFFLSMGMTLLAFVGGYLQYKYDARKAKKQTVKR